ncbi:competence protein ComK [Ornithinibacillus bavariensis]|uniref:Competence protein n=1 Tax=Ornithinibacillus bavariensis TaxID=545502 RepID=A0A920C839_9BACI|nr:competence protein [Ornithinibacillus bavariensis]
MSRILPHYEINERTMALLPSNNISYETIAMETDQTLYIEKTPFEIIKRGCLDNFCSFEGRRESIKYLTGFSRKVPIPISIYRNIFAFPTRALKDWKCGWIFYNHVESIVEDVSRYHQTLVIFKNGNQIKMDVTILELLKQLERTSLIKSLSSGALRS